MKKLALLLISLFILTGCSDIKDLSYDGIIANGLDNKYNYVNIYRKGYNYYLPKGLKLINNTDVNDIFTNNEYYMYLYVDRISFYNKGAFTYQKNNEAQYSQVYENTGKKGYLEINNFENDKYLIEIMYNYAKIEVIVDKDNINESISYAITILSSIAYNENVIASLMDEDVMNFKEEEYDIFSTISNDGNVLKYDENLKDNDVEDNYIPDTDLIN
ncbi:MAG: membrane lipoprotein lipid attachment site-containing protein [Bacilli bacterium]|nr:membrane lipoprotein lipid attachment site-containing protein [Bacilli bacterium]